MRIVSFLPSATEILFALRLEDEVVGVTFECDYPQGARSKPQVVHSHLAPGLAPAEIDAIVRAEGAHGRSLYFADYPLLESLAPDLILLQDLCRVCAIDSPMLARDVGRLGSMPQVLSLSAHTLEGVLAEIEDVAKATGRTNEGKLLTESLRARVQQVRSRRGPRVAPRTLCLEWLDPFFQGGHWIPEMVLIAGGDPVLARTGEKSVRLGWEQIQAADPEIIVVMPCGYHLHDTMSQYRSLKLPQGWAELTAVRQDRVYAVDGSSYFSRPGPRLVDGLEILERVVRAESFAGLPPESVARLH